ncbi:hypothetical protein BD777DRAFT_130486 [Yarrowia lipolytica]|jgi:hypothetical protein|nr:hypothetical protein BD777DRAFT_130486 [Yarrowia lipolytica]
MGIGTCARTASAHSSDPQQGVFCISLVFLPRAFVALGMSALSPRLFWTWVSVSVLSVG